MKVSVIIPTYNVEAYITECLESVVQQTYTDEMECLIVDDCGTDGSVAVAEKFIQSYHGAINFRIVHREKNGGLSAARNSGFEVATGDYIYFLDSDDAIIPETIEEMMKVVQGYPLVEMVQGGIANIEGKAVEDFTRKELPIYTEDQTWIIKNIMCNLPVSSCNRLLRKDFLMKNNMSFHEGIIHEDVPYCFHLALKSRKVGFVRKNTYLFRPQREGSITNTPQENRALQSRLIIMHDCIDTYLSHRFETKNIQAIALKALWKKWMYYMMIHSTTSLSCYTKDISKISRLMSDMTPFPLKTMTILYGLLPLRLKGNVRVIKLFSFFYYIRQRYE